MAIAPPRPANPDSRPARGFTLIELLVVVAVLSSVALLAFGVATEDRAQLRYNDTRTRLGQLERAILGRLGPVDAASVASLLSFSQLTVSGFGSKIGASAACVFHLESAASNCAIDVGNSPLSATKPPTLAASTGPRRPRMPRSSWPTRTRVSL